MVEIKVDLKRNSKEDIRKVIDFLQKFVDEDAITESPDISPGAFNLFSNPEPTSPSILPTADEQEDIPDDDEQPSDSDLEIKPIFY